MSLLSFLALLGGLAVALTATLLVSPYLCRILAAALLTWADAWEDWSEARSRHWRRYNAHLLEAEK